MKKNKKLRLSYSFLLLWSQGKHDDALNLYFHKETVKSKAMEDGIALHKKWAMEIEGRKLLTLGKTALTFKNPECEKKCLVNYNEQTDLSGHLDCIDNDILYEFKSGVMSSSEYLTGYQLPFYFLICELSKIKVERGILVHYNQHENYADLMVLWNSKRQIDKARNFIDTFAGEIYEYFLQNNIPFDKP